LWEKDIIKGTGILSDEGMKKELLLLVETILNVIVFCKSSFS